MEKTQMTLEVRPVSLVTCVPNKEMVAAFTEEASGVANVLKDILERQKLYVTIGGRRGGPNKYVKCEGWTTLAAIMGYMAKEGKVVLVGDTYIATVKLVRLSDGVVISKASAECGKDESTWESRPAYARRSMAITRATSKVCRLAFSWVMTLAGYEPTPAEEMGVDVVDVREDVEYSTKRLESVTEQLSAPLTFEVFCGKLFGAVYSLGQAKSLVL